MYVTADPVYDKWLLQKSFLSPMPLLQFKKENMNNKEHEVKLVSLYCDM